MCYSLQSMHVLPLFLVLGSTCLCATGGSGTESLRINVQTFENNRNYRFKSSCCTLKKPSPEDYCDKACSLQFRICIEEFNFDDLLQPSTLTPHTGQCVLGEANLTNMSRGFNAEVAIPLRSTWPVSYL